MSKVIALWIAAIALAGLFVILIASDFSQTGASIQPEYGVESLPSSEIRIDTSDPVVNLRSVVYDDVLALDDPPAVLGSVTADPCAEMRAERDNLSTVVAHLQLQLERKEYPEDSPYGYFLSSSEAEGTTQDERNHVRYVLDDHPVEMLTHGEATWLIERLHQKDWKRFASTRDIAIIRFLGPERVLSQATPEALKNYSEWYDAAEWQMLFGSQKP